MSTNDTYDISESEYKASWVYFDNKFTERSFGNIDVVTAEKQFRGLCINHSSLATWCMTWLTESEMEDLRLHLQNIEDMVDLDSALAMLKTVAEREGSSISDVVKKYLTPACEDMNEVDSALNADSDDDLDVAL